jgi:prepilin-type N-terminal cleavage/methylation domain-containing protein
MFRRASNRAFTLIELLVVLAVLAVIAGLMVPAFARAHLRNGSEGCLSNLRQLMGSSIMYSEDNNDIIVPNAPLGVNLAWISGSASAEDWTTGNGNTNLAVIQNGLLAPYLGGQIRVYRCPADWKPSANGTRLRSYSMNGAMGGVSQTQTVRGYNAPGLIYIKMSDVTCPAPSSAFVLCDESMCTMNDTYLEIDTQAPDFPDCPANYHAGGCGFGMIDGHSEIHQWQTFGFIIEPYDPTYGYAGPNHYTPSLPGGVNNADWIWFRLHADCNPGQTP